VILLAVPIADTIKVLFERILSGRHPFAADRTHIHHIVYSKNIASSFIIDLPIYSEQGHYYFNGPIIHFSLQSIHY
jgi:UDP-GlcNAc:undecaprenyl-phosphate GlcNAc-1-phosphate transferase